MEGLGSYVLNSSSKIKPDELLSNLTLKPSN